MGGQEGGGCLQEECPVGSSLAAKWGTVFVLFFL